MTKLRRLATINGTTTHNINNVNPNLSALANNGGLTQTMLPLPTSPAINAAPPANLPADTFDVDNDADTAEALPLDHGLHGGKNDVLDGLILRDEIKQRDTQFRTSSKPVADEAYRRAHIAHFAKRSSSLLAS